MGFTLKNITRADKNLRNKGNMGGLIDKIYVATVDDVKNLHLPDTEASDRPMVITQDIEMQSGKKFAVWYFTQGTGKFSSALVGETDGKSQEPSAEFSIPKYDEVSQTQITTMQNEDAILIVVLASGDKVILGTEEIPAKLLEGGGDSGSAFPDKNATRFMFKASSRFGAYFYEGSIDGLIDGQAIETTQMTTGTASAATDVVVVNWLDNSGFDGALATDKVNVYVNNTTKKDTFTRSNVATRDDATASITLANIASGDVLQVDVWFELAADATRISAKKRLNITAGA